MPLIFCTALWQRQNAIFTHILSKNARIRPRAARMRSIESRRPEQMFACDQRIMVAMSSLLMLVPMMVSSAFFAIALRIS